MTAVDAAFVHAYEANQGKAPVVIGAGHNGHDRSDVDTHSRALAGMAKPASSVDALVAPEPITGEEWGRARLAPDCIVENQLYADVALLIAPGGTGKTTFELYESICIALDLPLWGRVVFRHGRVVILTAEDTREILIARLREIAAAMSLSDQHIALLFDRIRILDVSDAPLKLTEVYNDVVITSTNVDRLIASLRGLKPSMIVIDPAISFGVGEARVNDAEQALIVAGRKLRNALNCTIQYIHHTGKGNARDKAVDQYAGRGGSTFPDGCRMVRILSPLTAAEWNKETGQQLTEGESGFRLALPKLSYCPPQPDIFIRRTGFLFKQVFPAGTSQPALRDANADMIHRLLASELALGHKHSKNSLEGAADLTKDNLTRVELRAAVDWLLACGRVVEAINDAGGKGGLRKYLHPIIASPNYSGDPIEKDDE